MSGLFTHEIYDSCYNNELTNQQINPGLFQLDKQRTISNNNCMTYNGPRGNSYRENADLNLTDFNYKSEIENNLLNIDLPNSKCIKNNTVNDKNNRLLNITNKQQLKNNQCSDFLDYKYSRLDNLALDLKTAHINRYDFPIIDPRENVYYGIGNTNQQKNAREGINTRLMLKDAIKK